MPPAVARAASSAQQQTLQISWVHVALGCKFAKRSRREFRGVAIDFHRVGGGVQEEMGLLGHRELEATLLGGDRISHVHGSVVHHDGGVP
mmetsp:Transcript_184/g.332  ORF Transcript_184/g.332 Transcript_184/m.332 type:complete len:90 (+) Transcript_184:42-311(+)